MALRLVMMGTGGFALPTFLRLYQTKHAVVGLFTQPDRTGHGHHRHPHPLKEAALEGGTPVFQPENVNTPAALDDLRGLNPDLCVVAAYGQILSPELLKIPRLAVINAHASLLPKYRGAAPVQYAIWKGETETGVTIIQIEPELDAGPILGIVRTPIQMKETAGELEQRLADLAAPLTVEVIDRLEAGACDRISQDSTHVTRAPRLRKTHGLIDWTESALEIERQVRAMQPWPRAYTFLQQPGREPLRLILLEIEPSDTSGESEPPASPGTVIFADSNRLVVQAGQGTAEVVRLQPEGKRPMHVGEFLRGHSVHPGDRLVQAP